MVRDLALLLDHRDPDARVDQMLLTVDAGHTASFSFASDLEWSVADLLDPRVLRSANDVVASAFPAVAPPPTLG